MTDNNILSDKVSFAVFKESLKDRILSIDECACIVEEEYENAFRKSQASEHLKEWAYYYFPLKNHPI